MVTVGDEGMRSKGDPSEPHAWINNGYEGVDFDCNLGAPNVDVSHFLLKHLFISLC
jgi:hypothetical protein